MHCGSNYLSVCIFPHVIENIPLASLPTSSKWVKLLCTREIYACCRKQYRNLDIEAAPRSCPTGTRGRPEMVVI